MRPNDTRIIESKGLYINMAYLEMNGVSYRYQSNAGGTHILHNVTLSMEQGEFCCFIGRSGCGKSTLLKLAGGLLQPTEGTVQLEGREIKAGPDLGFVFQKPTLLEWRTVIDNVLLPVSLQRRPLPDDRDRARLLLRQMGMEPYADRYPQHLSGGQQSRVALARALVTNPKLILLDEPFAALDAITREEIQEELLQVITQSRMTALFVTHDIGEAIFLADRVLALRDGNIVEAATVPYSRPRLLPLRYESDFISIVKNARRTLEHGI
jgi:NitT/TauT family transport system ATP-binding protein